MMQKYIYLQKQKIVLFLCDYFTVILFVFSQIIRNFKKQSKFFSDKINSTYTFYDEQIVKKELFFRHRANYDFL